MAQAVEAPASSTSAEGLTSHTPNQEGLAVLRADFPTEQIHQLPRLKCPACRQSRTGVCENPRHAKSECKKCGNYISNYHLHLDYVGHAELTNRLLEADPLWSWEPLSFGQNGLPQFDNDGGLWIRLTVCGHTRLGYGDAQGKKGPNAVKEAIGDALRNAAMRFGAALDLWAKSDLREAETEHPKSADEDVHHTPAPARPSPRQAPPASAPPAKQPAPAAPAPAAASSDGPDPLDRLVAQYQDPAVWNNRVALLQVRLDGKKHEVSNRSVQGPDGSWTKFDALLEARIDELKAGAAERNAA